MILSQHVGVCSQEPQLEQRSGRGERGSEQWFSPLGSSAGRIAPDPSSARLHGNASDLTEVSSSPGQPALPHAALASGPRVSNPASGSSLGQAAPSVQRVSTGMQQQQPPQPALVQAHTPQSSPMDDLLGLDTFQASAWPASMQPALTQQSSQAAQDAASTAQSSAEQAPVAQRFSHAEPAPVRPAAEWQPQWPAASSVESLPVTHAAHGFWHSVKPGQQSSPFDAAGSAEGLARQSQYPPQAGLGSQESGNAQSAAVIDGSRDAELAALRQEVRGSAHLKQSCILCGKCYSGVRTQTLTKSDVLQLEVERSGRLTLLHNLHACRAAEKRLNAEVCSLETRLRHVSLPLCTRMYQQYQLQSGSEWHHALCSRLMA